MIGSENVTTSTQFYRDFLGFRKTDDDPGAPDGQVLEHDQSELLIIPFPKERLPNPNHFAVEVSTQTEFNTLLKKAEIMNLSPRSMPDRTSLPGPAEFSRSKNSYRIFYVTDPSGVILEIMVKL